MKKVKSADLKAIKADAPKWVGSPKKREQILTRFFGKLPFQEAKHNALLVPTAADRGDPYDPFKCELANCAKRMYGCERGLVVGTVAYLDMPDGKGKRAINRFMLSKAGHRAVFRNDKGIRRKAPEQVVLLAPTHRQKLETMREYNRKRRSNPNTRLRTTHGET